MLLNVHYDLLPMREALDVVVLSGLGLVRIFCIFLYMFSYLGPIVFRMFFFCFWGAISFVCFEFICYSRFLRI